MSWEEVVGQEEAVAVLSHAAAQPEAMTHAWLITGPPGSGRSVAARAFAAALQSPGDPDSREARTAFAGTHADVRVHVSEKVLISIEEARGLAELAQLAPSTGRWRIVIIEDADRLAERTANVLLKAIEEPPERTVWILCAPSAVDLLPTIRSRCRQVNLRIPAPAAVADLLTRRDGVEPQLALTSAIAAQSHIGVARRLALHEDVRAYREHVLRIPGRIRGVGDAVIEAGSLVETAREQSRIATEERDAAERAEFLRASGIEAEGRIPPALRTQLRHLEEDQKRRARRSLLDTLDRALVDLLSLYRDVVTVQLGAAVGLINRREEALVRELAADSTPEQTLRRLSAITRTRDRFAEFTSISPQLALESLFIALRPQG